MINDLEDEMRLALFGGAVPSGQMAPPTHMGNSKPKPRLQSPKIKVTLSVSNVFEGETELFIYEANTLSKITAEIDARAAAKKKKFKYIDVVTVEKVG